MEENTEQKNYNPTLFWLTIFFGVSGFLIFNNWDQLVVWFQGLDKGLFAAYTTIYILLSSCVYAIAYDWKKNEFIPFEDCWYVMICPLTILVIPYQLVKCINRFLKSFDSFI